MAATARSHHDVWRMPGLVALLALLPIGVLWIYKVVLVPRPFWIHDFDPEIIYFYAGADLLAGQTPTNINNPATPVQLISAGLVAFTGSNPLEFDAFRKVAYATSFLLTILTVCLLLRTLLAKLPPALQVVSTWTYFLCPMSLKYLTIWSPEVFFFPVGALALLALHRTLGPTETRRREATGFVAGLAIGFCCSIKFLFLAWIPALCLSLAVAPSTTGIRRFLRIAWAIPGIIFGFMAGTLPIVREYPAMFSLLWRFATHSGSYGSGAMEIPSMGTMAENLLTVVSRSGQWHLWWLSFLIVVLIALQVDRRGNRRLGGWSPLVLFAVIGILGAHLTVIRGATLRYLLPTGLCGLLVVVIAAQVAPALRSGRLQAVALAIGGLLLAHHVLVDVRAHRHQIAQGRAEREHVEGVITANWHADEPPVVVYSWRFPTPSFALRCITDNREMLAMIEEKYPTEGHYSPWEGVVELPEGRDRWDFLVIRNDLISEFPGELGSQLSSVGRYRVYARSDPGSATW